MERFVCHKVVEAAKIVLIYGKGRILENGVVECSGGDWVLGLEGGEKVTLAAKHDPEQGGYFVRYDDGYTSYSPAAPFEEGYSRVQAAAGYGIGWALEQMRGGRSVSRAGWNGRRMFLRIQVPDVASLMSLPYVYLSTVEGNVVPWLCSQTDLLADDWQLAD